jgi:ketosteroid isomerase-like protein
MTIAERYVDAVNAADIESLLSLFADDATLRNPSGIYEGKEAIRGFYEGVVLAGQAIVTIDTQFNLDGVDIVQLSATSHLAEKDAPVLHAADVFVISDGRIDELDIYYR